MQSDELKKKPAKKKAAAKKPAGEVCSLRPRRMPSLLPLFPPMPYCALPLAATVPAAAAAKPGHGRVRGHSTPGRRAPLLTFLRLEQPPPACSAVPPTDKGQGDQAQSRQAQDG